MWQSPALGSAQFLVDTHDIVTDQNIGYRPILEEEQGVVPNPYSREGMAQ